MPTFHTTSRRLLLRSLVESGSFASQDELRLAVAAEGHDVTQTTISRDLAAIGVRKVAGPGGTEIYRPTPTESEAEGRRELASRLRDFATSVAASGNLVVVRTSPGAAGTVAAALDDAALPQSLGSIAGDDTIFLVSRDADGGDALSRTLTRILEDRSP